MSTEDNSCLICLEENCDTVLRCCGKNIHGSCIKQWWDTNNIKIEDATCPHCRQRVILEKTNPIIERLPNNTPISNNSSSRVHPIELIRYNSNYNLSNSEIDIINSNVNNQVPNNPFLHDFVEDRVRSWNPLIFFLTIIFIMIFIGLLLIILD